MEKITTQTIDFIDDDPMDDVLDLSPAVDNERTAKDKNVMSFGSWIATFLIMMVPGIGLLFLFAWAFGCGNRSRVNFARAILLFAVLFMLLFTFMAWAFKDNIFDIINRFYSLRRLIDFIR